jgi:predicted nucleotidyltransferase
LVVDSSLVQRDGGTHVPAISAQSAFRYPLSIVFSGQAAVRISREMFLHGGPLTVRQLVARTGVTRMTVYQVLEPLMALGLVQRIGSSYAGLFQIAAAHPLSSYLADLFRAEDRRVRDVYSAIRDAAEEVDPKPLAVWLYGSVARGEDTVASDFDLAVCAEDESVDDVAEALREALRPVGERLFVSFSVVGVSPQDLLRLSTNDDPFWTTLVRDAYPLTGHDPEAILRLHSGAMT